MAENLIGIENISKRFGDRELFNGVSFTLCEGEKTALVGTNGCGKSTLMKIILKQEEADSGNIIYKKDLRISYLPQNPEFVPGETVIEAVLRNQKEVANVIKQYEEAIEKNNDDALILKLTHEMDRLNAWDVETEIKRTLSQLGIKNLDEKVENLSGGGKKRVALAAALMCDSDILIMDEPTNHLDLAMVEWLEEILSNQKKAILMVTHDRYFLDRVCNKIIEIADLQAYSYIGNYSYYLEKKEQRREIEERTEQHLRNAYRREIEWVRRQPQARGGKAKYRLDRFQEIEARLKNKRTEEELSLKQGKSYIGSKVLEAQYISKKFDAKVILDNFYYNMARREKLGITGENGSGKTTLLKMITGEAKPDSGQIEIGETVRIGYYSQELKPEEEGKKVIDVVKAHADVVDLGTGQKFTASQLLTQFLFSPSRQQDYVYKLSGGERKRLALCEVLMSSPNLLILDEPTNDLDITTLAILEEYLANFPGNVIIVSHDRYFMDKTIDHLLVFKGNGVVKDFPGNYSDYRIYTEMEEQKKAEETAKKSKTQQETTANNYKQKNPSSKKLSYKEQKLLEQLNIDIDNLTKEKQEIEEIMSSGTLSPDEIIKKSKRFEELSNELDEKEMMWLELSEKAEA